MLTNFFEIKKKAIYILLSQNTSSYPIDVVKLISDLGDDYILLPFSKMILKHPDLSRWDIISSIQSEDAVTCYKKGKPYRISYDDSKINKQRIRWNLAHELGHCVLNHLDNSQCYTSNELNDKEYSIYEAEANLFAAELLSNLCILDYYNISSEKDIMRICDLSKQAASNRYDTYLKWSRNKFKSDLDIILLENFMKFNNSKWCCSICNKQHNKNSTYEYCNICGSKLNLVEGYIMKYYSHDLDQKGKAIKCPNCENEEVHEGPYCDICGSYLINRCTNEDCLEVSNGNSRFCQYCGSKTTFLINELLEEYYDEYNANKSNVNTKVFIPIDDDDIPF